VTEYRITKEFAFSAAHALRGLSPEHPCSQLHGHNYIVRVELAEIRITPLPGFVRDYGELTPFKDYVDEHFDHKWLGWGSIARIENVETVRSLTTPAVTFNPTAENLAKHFFDYCHAFWSETARVGVSETPKTWAYYEA